MHFLCLAYYDEKKFAAMPKEERSKLVAQCPAWDEKLRKTGKYRIGASLEPQKLSKVLRPTGGKPTITDGPFTEAKELAGGFIIIEATNMEEAVKVASLHPAANIGGEVGWCIEIRPIGMYLQFGGASS
jgi:hypothetical protein